MQDYRPVTASERSEILDMLRGFALLGIFLANSAAFSLFIMRTTADRTAMPTADVDYILMWFHFAFVDGKFYSLFSLLFGIGFSIIFFRNRAKGQNGLAVFYRRLFILLFIGVFHTILLWEGDILMFYAVVGMFLPLFRNVPDKKLLILAAILLLSPLLFDLAKVLSDGRLDISTPFLEQAMATDKKMGIDESNVSKWLLVNTSYSDLITWNTGGFWWNTYFRMSSNRPVKVLAMFLIGLYAGRNMIFNRLGEYRSLLRKVQLIGFGIGIPAGFLHAYAKLHMKSLPNAEGMWDTLFYVLNVTPVALAYASTIALWHLNGKFSKLIRPLRHLGRMALTNYLMQSVFGVLIYYGIGLGLGRIAGPAYFVPIAIVVFIIQILYSKFWMRHFNYGPAEWIWRQLTYLKRLPLKRG